MASSASSLRRQSMTTLAPLAARSLVVSNPIPVLPPVTMAVFPSKRRLDLNLYNVNMSINDGHTTHHLGNELSLFILRYCCHYCAIVSLRNWTSTLFNMFMAYVKMVQQKFFSKLLCQTIQVDPPPHHQPSIKLSKNHGVPYLLADWVMLTQFCLRITSV